MNASEGGPHWHLNYSHVLIITLLNYQHEVGVFTRWLAHTEVFSTLSERSFLELSYKTNNRKPDFKPNKGQRILQTFCKKYIQVFGIDYKVSVCAYLLQQCFNLIIIYPFKQRKFVVFVKSWLIRNRLRFQGLDLK